MGWRSEGPGDGSCVTSDPDTDCLPFDRRGGGTPGRGSPGGGEERRTHSEGSDTTSSDSLSPARGTKGGELPLTPVGRHGTVELWSPSSTGDWDPPPVLPRGRVLIPLGTRHRGFTRVHCNRTKHGFSDSLIGPRGSFGVKGTPELPQRRRVGSFVPVRPTRPPPASYRPAAARSPGRRVVAPQGPLGPWTQPDGGRGPLHVFGRRPPAVVPYPGLRPRLTPVGPGGPTLQGGGRTWRSRGLVGS